MNKIYKVIWSKAKHTYVVASEIAKGHTKGETTGKGLKKLAAAMLVAAALLSPSFAWAEDTATVELAATGSTTAAEVYTKEGTDKQIDAANKYTYRKAAELDKKLTDQKTSTALHVSKDGNLIVGTKENHIVKNMKINGQLTSGSISTGAITSSGDVTVAGKMAADGVTDETTKNGTYIKQNNTVGNNLVSLDTQVKANADAINEEAQKRKYSVTNLEKADAAETAAREAADTEIKQAMKDQKTSTALHVSKDGNLIVGTKENQIVQNMKINKQLTSGSISTGAITSTGDVKVTGKVEAGAVYDDTTKTGNYVVQTNSVGANLSALDTQVKTNADAINEEARKRKYSVTNLENADAAETAAREAADTELNERITNEANAIHETTNQLQSDLNTETADRKTADNELNERITNEANAIHETTHQLQNDLTTETTAREAGDKALDDRITNVKEYVLSETVSKTDAAVQDGAIVKAANTIGENVTNLDAALAKETAARIGADKAQDKVIQQVNQNMVEGFNTINKNMSDGFTALSQADANELAGRVAADTELVKATNGGLALNDKNVLQKNETTIENGTVTNKTTAADTLIMNEGATNQITLSKNGIKVGTNSTVIASDGVFAGGDTADKAKAALNADGSIKGANGAFTVDTKGNVTSTLTVKGATLTDGTATISNGNIKTNGGFIQTGGGNVNTQGGEVRTNGGKVATSGGEINTGSGDIKTVGGDILTAGGKLSTSGGDIAAGTGNISGQNITASGVLSGDSLTVAKGMTGHSLTLTGGDLDAGAGTIKTTGAVETGTLTTTGNATIGGNLTVDKNLKVNGEFNAETLSSKLDANNYTTINGGNVTSVNSKVDTDDGRTYTSSSKLTEKGRTDTAANGTTRNVSTQTASESGSTISSLADEKQKSYITQNLKKILQGIQNGTNESIVDQTETGIKSTATDGKNTASTNLSNGGFNTYATDGTNKTYTLQTAESLTSQIGDDGKVKSVMNADGITNNADGGTITNSAKDLVNTATGDMTNTVGGKLLNDVTGDMENKVGGNLTTTVNGKVTEDFKSDLKTTIGGNKSETVAGTSEEKVTGKKTETYGGLETTVNGNQTTTVTGDVTEDYKSNLSTTVGGNQTTTVTGDSSLTAENIKNEAKNKITNKALDVETDASSSIVNKVSNDAGSNTSTQLSYQTTEKMSQADGKTASYLRGAVEEKSQLTDGDKKTTIDTVAGQTNTNITDGTNTSNNLQKADQVASSVTDGKSTTVVNQDAKSLASSITDGTKANNTNNTVDKSEQLIKASDTQYSATTKTATKTEDALVSGSSVIDVIKNLDDAANPLISSAVTDGTNTTGSTMTAKGITNSAAESIVNEIGDGSKVKSEMTAKGITNTAKDGTITNDAKDLVNTATGNMTNTVGGTLTTTVTGKVTEDYKSDLDTKVGGNETHYVKGNQTNTVSGDRTVSVKGTETENFNAQVTNIKTEQRTSVGGNQTNIVAGNQQNTVSGSKTENVKGSVTEKYGSQATTVDGDQSTNVGGNQSNVVAGDQTNTISGSKTETVKGAVTETYGSQTTKVNGDQSTTVAGKQTNSITGDQVNTIGGNQTTTVTGDSSLSAKNITNTAEGGTISNKSKDILNEASGDIINWADGEIGNVASKITNITGDNTVTSDTNGTTFENKAHSTAIEEGAVTKTTISGNTLETGKATMDYAEVMKNLGVRGNATVDGNTTLGKEGADTTLTVNSTSTFNKDVTMKSNATVEKDLTVKGTTTTDKLVVSNGATVSGGTTTDTLHVTSTSRFDGAATFKDIVTMEKDLNVGGNAKVAGDVTAKSFKVGENTYIDENGINANGKVIKNVGKGDISNANSTDAVSGGQLYETNTRVSGLETRMGTVETRVDKLDNKIDKVGANAAAMANLHPLEFDEDSKWNIAAAVGSSGSETASAVGVFYRPNENVMVNASAAMGTGENMFGGGVSLRLGHGGNKAKEAQMKAAAKENRELRAKVDDLTARMDALLSVLNPNMSKDFPDVPENHWAYEAVSRLAGNGIVEGYEDGKYHGERQMTRYEMAEIIYNALSKGAKAEKKLVEEFRPELQAMAAQKKA